MIEKKKMNTKGPIYALMVGMDILLVNSLKG